MAFTTATVISSVDAREQFQGLYSKMYKAKFTVDPASIAAGAEDSATFTVPGVELGDQVLGWSAGVDLTADADIEVYVSAANTVTIRISNLHASSALDLATSTWKVLVGKPAW